MAAKLEKQQLKPSFLEYPVNMEDVCAKLLWADVSVSFNVRDQQGLPSSANAWLFAQYLQFTAYVDPQADTDRNSSDGSDVSDQDQNGLNEWLLFVDLNSTLLQRCRGLLVTFTVRIYTMCMSCKLVNLRHIAAGVQLACHLYAALPGQLLLCWPGFAALSITFDLIKV